jgi:hypothetical protein
VLLGGGHNPRLAALAAVLAMPSPSIAPSIGQAYRRQQPIRYRLTLSSQPDVRRPRFLPQRAPPRLLLLRPRHRAERWRDRRQAERLLCAEPAAVAAGRQPRTYPPPCVHRARSRASRFIQTTGSAADYLHDPERSYEVVRCT